MKAYLVDGVYIAATLKEAKRAVKIRKKNLKKRNKNNDDNEIEIKKINVRKTYYKECQPDDDGEYS